MYCSKCGKEIAEGNLCEECMTATAAEEMSLTEYVKKNGRMDAMRVFVLMRPIMESLKKSHGAGTIHGNITPDNVFFLKNGTLKLAENASVELKRGYAPEELYRANGQKGPWTDVYGLCATMYYFITGIAPEDALDRLHTDRIKKPSEYNLPIPQLFEDVLMYGLAVRVENRCRTMAELLHILDTAPSVSVTFKNPRLSQDTTAPKKKNGSATAIIIVCAVLLSIGIVFAVLSGSDNSGGGLANLFGGSQKVVEKVTGDDIESQTEDVEEQLSEMEDAYEEQQDVAWEDSYEEMDPDYTIEYPEEEFVDWQTEGQIFPDSAERKLKKEDLVGLTAEECRIARNEIYARHGRKFKDEELQAYFEQFEWYVPSIDPDDFTEDMLNKYEKSNRDMLVEYEEEMGYR